MSTLTSRFNATYHSVVRLSEHSRESLLPLAFQSLRCLLAVGTFAGILSAQDAERIPLGFLVTNGATSIRDVAAGEAVEIRSVDAGEVLERIPPRDAPGWYAVRFSVSGIGYVAKTDTSPLLEGEVEAFLEKAATRSVRQLMAAEGVYNDTVGEGFYATLAQLGEVGLIDPLLASGTKNGYAFSISIGEDWTTFQITARPLTYGLTGTRSYFASRLPMIRFTAEDRNAVATDTPLR